MWFIISLVLLKKTKKEIWKHKKWNELGLSWNETANNKKKLVFWNKIDFIVIQKGNIPSCYHPMPIGTQTMSIVQSDLRVSAINVIYLAQKKYQLL